MQPYQLASQAIREHAEILPETVKKTALLAANAGGTAFAYKAGASLLKKALPLLSSFIPEDLAIKGLNKLDSRFGKFIQKSFSEGKTFDDVKEFIENKSKEEEKKEEKKNASLKAFNEKLKNPSMLERETERFENGYWKIPEKGMQNPQNGQNSAQNGAISGQNGQNSQGNSGRDALLKNMQELIQVLRNG